MLEIKGDYLEGGGQIIRTALALSSITQKPFIITDIRKGRKEPGLKEQHLQTVRAAAKLCNAKVEGDKLGSIRLSFIPRKITNTDLEINISTAGSTALVLQSLLIAGTQHNLNIHINGGGTWNKNASSILYFQKVLVPIFKKINYCVEIEAINQEGRFSEEKLLEQCKEYMSLFKIQEKNLISGSYGDLLLKKLNK